MIFIAAFWCPKRVVLKHSSSHQAIQWSPEKYPFLPLAYVASYSERFLAYDMFFKKDTDTLQYVKLHLWDLFHKKIHFLKENLFP